MGDINTYKYFSIRGVMSRLDEFWKNQERLGVGSRVIACNRLGFITEWSIGDSFPLEGNFEIWYDDGEIGFYDAFFLRYSCLLLDASSRWRDSFDSKRSSYCRYCEHLFLSKLKS